MLHDLIMKNVNIIVPSSRNKTNGNFYQLRGEVEIIGTRNGEQFYYDKGHNVVTIWAKHANMHLLTGEVFSNKGQSRIDGTHSGDTNSDGTIVSGAQYLTGDSLEWWSVDETGVANQKYAFFPTKMLFGTGKEFENWAAMDGSESTYYATTAGGSWTQAAFDANIEDSKNSYSNDFSGDTLQKRKSINDIYAATLVTPVITDNSFGITGAIKHSLYETSPMPGGDSAHLEIVSGNFFADDEHKGIGYPCFIYARRDNRFYQSGTEVGLSYDSHVENKITFTVTMPEQTGANAGKFYPYNGFTLKEAGLFCDAKFILKNTQPTSDGEGDDSPQEEFDNWMSMPYGIMYAKRYIAPITKSQNVGITARWTLYL